jgi:hypothetical protein
MEFSKQEHKWFSIILFIILPFYAFYKILKGDLPPLKNVGPKK